MIKTNSTKAWFLACRPKTLTGAIVPVAIALALAWRDNSNLFEFFPAVLCLAFACMMQIDANLVNDYYDCLKGIDSDDRLGPERACAQGWITMSAMKKALMIVTMISAAIGLPLIIWGGWEMIVIGLACIVFCFLYTTLLSGKAMGDVLVLLFFGIVPICTTYYLQIHEVSVECVMLSVGCGLATDNLLIVNNFRDRETDRKHGKMTLVTIIGEKPTLILSFALTLGASALALAVTGCNAVATTGILIYTIVASMNTGKMWKINKGSQLNSVLGKTTLGILLYGIAVCAGLSA